MPAFRPPRPPRRPRLLTRQGEALACSIQRLAPDHRDIVARIISALQPRGPEPDPPGGAEPGRDPGPQPGADPPDKPRE